MLLLICVDHIHCAKKYIIGLVNSIGMTCVSHKEINQLRWFLNEMGHAVIKLLTLLWQHPKKVDSSISKKLTLVYSFNFSILSYHSGPEKRAVPDLFGNQLYRYVLHQIYGHWFFLIKKILNRCKDISFCAFWIWLRPLKMSAFLETIPHSALFFGPEW